MKFLKYLFFIALISTVGLNAQQIYINEILSTGSPDWVELYNPNNYDVDLSNWHTWDPSTVGSHYILPAQTIIPAHGFLVLLCDDGNNGLHTNYKLSSGGETVWLGNSTGAVVDSVIFPALTSGTSYGRMPDGSPVFEVFTSPTQGAANGVTINNPPSINNPVRNPFYPTKNDDVIITVVVTDDSGLDPEVKLYFDNGNGWTSVVMSMVSTSNYTATISPLPAGTVVKYYIEAKDNLNAFNTNPATAPINYYSYTVLENPYVAPKVYVNEIMASNTATITDPDFNANADYIELYNMEDSEIDLSNWYLTDNLSNPVKWQFPQGVKISAKGYLLVWADSKDTVLTGVHSGFALSKNGEAAGLFNADAFVVDTVSFPALGDNYVYARNGDGLPEWIITNSTTPGAPNAIVSVENTDVIANSFMLSQNYPNPFNPSTTIMFSITDNNSKTVLQVYDILGNLVKTLVNENLAKGNYKVTFNANNLSSGVYIYKLQNGTNLLSRKMMLVK
jgi:hypothetical protein